MVQAAIENKCKSTIFSVEYNEKTALTERLNRFITLSIRFNAFVLLFILAASIMMFVSAYQICKIIYKYYNEKKNMKLQQLDNAFVYDEFDDNTYKANNTHLLYDTNISSNMYTAGDKWRKSQTTSRDVLLKD